MFCRECNYDLRHRPKGVCPECGAIYDIDIPETWLAKPILFHPARFFCRSFSALSGVGSTLLILAVLVEIQFFHIDSWHGTKTEILSSYGTSSYWEPYLLGEIALMIQIALFSAISIIAGILICRFVYRKLAYVFS